MKKNNFFSKSHDSAQNLRQKKKSFIRIYQTLPETIDKISEMVYNEIDIYAKRYSRPERK